ncbi:MAG: hypothetical protein JW787_01555 [Sedimentisphaerales bacterium]|nr:hypothetical protein [Sedimentisphaerales bacterium]
MKSTKFNQKCVFAIAVIVFLTMFFRSTASENIPENALANMPVKEITVFKDGHTFVLHEGQMPTDTDGNIVLDYLPRPIIGTFWSYSADSKTKLAGVVSGKRIVSIDRTALNIPELIRANIGAKVKVSEIGLDAYECTIFAIPSRSSEELRRTSPESNPDELPQQGNIVMLKYEGGIKAVSIDRIQQITFLEEPQPSLEHKEFRNIMTLKLDWNKSAPAKTANVGMMYVQKGIRWIPNYRVEIDGKGQAVIKLQATIINELTDIENVKAHLVIGVPTFAFQETVDPISLQQTVAQLSSNFQRNSRTAYSFDNAIMSQVRMSERNVEVPVNNETIDLGPEVASSGKNEDLYIFTLENITLKKGQRMVVPIGEYKLKYKDVYVLDLPFGPPPEVRERFNNDQVAQLARLYNAPKAIHKIRISNTADCPLTTAPALILRDGRIISQGMMTYTAIGAACDLELTTAVDISVKKLDEETERIPNSERWNNNTYSRSNMTGTISLTNHRTDTIELEVRRSVLGNIDDANKEGKITHIGRHEGEWMTTDSFPFWWNWYSWPYWWYHFNSVGQVNWDIKLKPDESISLEYKWHYFWLS